MSDIELTSTSTEGYATTSLIGDWELTIDATDAAGPNPNAVLVADYASCFVPAMRVGASQAGLDDLGRVEVDATADLDEGDDLADSVDEVLDRAEDICHVHTALREELHADITIEDGVEF